MVPRAKPASYDYPRCGAMTFDNKGKFHKCFLPAATPVQEHDVHCCECDDNTHYLWQQKTKTPNPERLAAYRKCQNEIAGGR